MIDQHEKFALKDLDGKSTFFVEVNWKDDEKVNECKVVKFTFPDGKTSFIKKEHLLAMLFAIGNESEQRKMIPQRVVKSRWYETVLGITATKDIKRGKKINFKVKIPLPKMEEEILGEVKDMAKSGKLKGYAKKSGIIVPNK